MPTVFRSSLLVLILAAICVRESLSRMPEQPASDVPALLDRYRATADGRGRAELLKELAATGDPRAAVALGEALEDGELAVRVAGTYGLIDHFMPAPVAGGTEQHVAAAAGYWRESEREIRLRAARLGRQIPLAALVRPTSPAFAADEPLLLEVELHNGLPGPLGFIGYGLEPTEWNAETASITLVDIRRGAEIRGLFLRRPAVSPPHGVSGQGRRMVEAGGSLRLSIDARKWQIQGGWTPGRYHVNVRVENLQLDDFTTASTLSDFATFEIR